jgi:hypothetical protein
MTPLFHCEVCGFLSTRGGVFRRVGGVLLDNACERAYANGDEQITRWVIDARSRKPIGEQP